MQNPDTKTLLCPFCDGNKPERIWSAEDYLTHIKCSDCGARTDAFGTSELAWIAWNTRATPVNAAPVTDAERAKALKDFKWDMKGETFKGLTTYSVNSLDASTVETIERALQSQAAPQVVAGDLSTKAIYRWATWFDTAAEKLSESPWHGVVRELRECAKEIRSAYGATPITPEPEARKVLTDEVRYMELAKEIGAAQNGAFQTKDPHGTFEWVMSRNQIIALCRAIERGGE